MHEQFRLECFAPAFDTRFHGFGLSRAPAGKHPEYAKEPGEDRIFMRNGVSHISKLGDSYPLVKAMLPIVLSLSLVACGPTPQKQTRSEIAGTQQERVARATAILTKYCQPPGPLFDAHMAKDVADNSGGMVPGPSDHYFSGVITFPPSDLPKWRDLLSPQLDHAPSLEFHSVLSPPAWWPASSAFEGCEYYEPRKLTGRSSGFVALSPSASAIYFNTHH